MGRARPLHVASEFYDVVAFRAGADTLRPFEHEEVGDVGGRSLLHLQCHFGLDSMSWARRGAAVTGLDFSKPAVEAANELASELTLEARFIAADLYDARAALEGERFEIVYTGLGALNWLPDLDGWARIVADSIAPGGFLYLAEFHPFEWVFADDDLTVVRDYFNEPEGEVLDEGPGSYADLDATTQQNATREWAWPVSDVISAILGAGLSLELFHEHDYTLHARWPAFEAVGGELGAGRVYRPPAGWPRLPLMYSLRARRRG